MAVTSRFSDWVVKSVGSSSISYTTSATKGGLTLEDLMVSISLIHDASATAPAVQWQAAPVTIRTGYLPPLDLERFYSPTPIRGVRSLWGDKGTSDWIGSWDTTWAGPVQIAYCFYGIKSERHHSPDPDCGCGLYVYKLEDRRDYVGDLFISQGDDYWRTMQEMLCLTELTGTVIEHTGGYRGEKAKVIEALVVTWPKDKHKHSPIVYHLAGPAVGYFLADRHSKSWLKARRTRTPLDIYDRWIKETQ